MPGLTDQAVGNDKPKQGAPEKAQQTWEESMLNMLDRLRTDLRAKDPYLIATHCDAIFKDNLFSLSYWGESLSIHWSELKVNNAQGDPCSTFDSAMIIYYLQTADGTSMADRWIGFRELPNGAFYNQAFQGYTGNRLAKTFGETPHQFAEAAEALGGWKLPA